MFDRKQVADDVRRLWATGWFEDIRAEAIGTAQGLRVIFTLVDQSQLFLRRIEFDPEDEKREVTLEPGTPIDSAVVEQVAAELRRHLIDEGHANAEVEAAVTPVGLRQADLRLRVKQGGKYRVAGVRFSGALGLEQGELRRALQAAKIRSFFPGIPGLWKGWRSLPPFSRQRVQADLQRIRSLYLSRGYVDADVKLAGVDYTGDKARITINVQSGSRYGVREVQIIGAGTAAEPTLTKNGAFPAKELCRCLREASDKAEKEGKLDFAVSMEARKLRDESIPLTQNFREATSRHGEDESSHDSEEKKWISLTAMVDPGPTYTVGRIEFRGHSGFDDLILRRAVLLQEGDLFDRRRLRWSLARLNRLHLFEPLQQDNVQLISDDGHRVNLMISVKEQARGRWSLSGPLGPMSWFGPLQTSVGSRLPPWGRGALDLSTYYAGFSLFSFAQPVLSAFLVDSKTYWQPLFAVSRPHLPGQDWSSGFTLSPQVGWRGGVASYGLTHIGSAARRALEPDPGAAPGLAAPVTWRSEEVTTHPLVPYGPGSLLCSASGPRWKLARSVAITALDWLLSTAPP